MSDPTYDMHDRRDDSALLPSWTAALLRQDVPSSAAARDRIMTRVRAAAGVAPVRTLSAPMRRSRWNRRGLLAPVGAALAAATLAALFAVRLTIPGISHGLVESQARIVGDTVIPRLAPGADSPGPDSPGVDSPGAGARSRSGVHALLFDTLRVVEFIVRGGSMRSVAVVGDFNGWSATATRLALRDGAWRARVVVPRDALHFGYLIDGQELVPAATLPALHALPDTPTPSIPASRSDSI